jgi:hypothetical protein
MPRRPTPSSSPTSARRKPTSVSVRGIRLNGASLATATAPKAACPSARRSSLGAAIALGLPWLWSATTRQLNRIRQSSRETRAKQERLAAIRAFSAAHPDWHLRVYETPAGYRLLAMHAVYDPAGEQTRAAFKAVQTDLRFARLCALQHCFRARVSPKYWRMGYRAAESLPKSKWPFPLAHLPRRQRWIEGYTVHARAYAACRFIERLGSTTVHPEAEAVRALHDELCQAHRDLPIA